MPKETNAKNCAAQAAAGARTNQQMGLRAAESLRCIVKSAMQQQVLSTAISFGSQLTQLPDASISDYVLFARCFLLSGEHRRCLAALEHRGVLSADNIQLISQAISIKSGAADGQVDNVNLSEIRELLSAVQLAANCLLSLKEYEDCLTLLSPLTSEIEAIFRDEPQMQLFYERSNSIASVSDVEINPVAVLFGIVGQCMNMLENRPKAQMLLVVALRIDPACTESITYLILNGLIGQREKISIIERALETCARKNLDWLEVYYKELLAQGEPVATASERGVQPNATTLAHRADFMHSRCRPEEAYRLAREAYIIDPFDWNGGILVYIVSMVELGLKTELFYLGHELAQSHPAQAVTWYCIGCYYWCCKKLTMAQAFLQKATKIDKRFARAWIAFGHVLVALEESEHAISAYRTACRLLPGDHRAPTYMAKELIRTNNATLAVHILQGAHQLCPDDPVTLNELGVAALALDNMAEALHYFKSAVRLVSQFEGNYKYTDSEEILCNYGTCLRRVDRLEEALVVYQRCCTMNPRSAENHANVGFTLHLLGRFDEAIECYHAVLGFEPAHAFCSEMLNNAIEDSLSLAGPNDKGPVGLLFGSSESENIRQSNNDASEGMILSPLNGEKIFSAASFAKRELKSSTADDTANEHHFPASDNSALMDSMRSVKHVGFHEMSGMTGGNNASMAGSISGIGFHLNRSNEPETPFSSAGSVCPFPGFGMPSTGAASRTRPELTPDGSIDGKMQSPTAPTGRAGAEYSPYSYLLAVGGARRVSLNANKSVAFADDVGYESYSREQRGSGSADASPAPSSDTSGPVRGTDLSGVYSDTSGRTDESRTEFELCGALDDHSASFQSSPSVMSFSRVTGNLSWSADRDASRDSDR